MSQPTNLQALQKPVAAPVVQMGFFNAEGWELMQRVSGAFAKSTLVPQQYQGNLPNCIIAMDMAQRMSANPLMVMQNLYIVHGTPGWSSKFLIATINVSGRFSSLRYEWKGEPGSEDYGCRAWAIEKATGERLDGIWVTWAMVRAEGWNAKNGSKWKTMPDQMFVYRAAAFWQRAYAPELGMGLQTAEELHDVIDVERDASGTYAMPQQPAAMTPEDLASSQQAHTETVVEPVAEPVQEAQPAAEPQAEAAPAADMFGQVDQQAQPDQQTTSRPRRQSEIE